MPASKIVTDYFKSTYPRRNGNFQLRAVYMDYLRTRKLPIWDKESKEAKYVRKLGNNPDATYQDFREFAETRPADVVANIGLCMTHQANYLLDVQIRRLEQDFLKEGGLRERMTKARLKVRDKQRRD